MTEFNYRTALNHKLQQDEAETFLNRLKARQRQSARRVSRTVRQCVTTAIVNAALVATIITSSIFSLAIWLS